MMNYLWGSPSTPQPPAKRKLRIKVGPSVNTMSVLKVNDDKNPHFIDSPFFVGHIVVRVKNFDGITPDGSTPINTVPYFGTKRRLFSIQLSGRFKQEYSVDDVLFGAEFSEKVSPPMGASIAIKFANLIDPALQTDIYSPKPWLFSPMMCSMNYVNVQKPKTATAPLSVAALLSNSDKISVNSRSAVDEVSRPSSSIQNIITPTPSDILGEWIWGGKNDLEENNALLFPNGSSESITFASDNLAERRKYFQKQSNRASTKFLPDRVYHLEIFAPFIDLTTFDLTLGINVNLIPYLNKQPIRLLAKSKSKNNTFFVLEFDLLDEQGRGLSNLPDSEIGSKEDLTGQEMDDAEMQKRMNDLESSNQ